MKMLIAIPVMGQWELGRISLHCFNELVSQDTEFLLIDNSGSDSPWFRWMDMYPGLRWWYVNTGANIGLVRSCQLAYKTALEHESNILCLTHNDVWVYEKHWDQEVIYWFETAHSLGGIGLFGSKGCNKDGLRLDTFGSLIEMSGHGRKMTVGMEPAVTFDGFFMCYSMQMLKESFHPCPKCHGDGIKQEPDYVETCSVCHGAGGQRGGFDQRYQWHHMYDLDASLTSIKLGYKNIVLNLPCHHLSGLTANNDAYSTSGPDVHAVNAKLFLEKWQPHLGVTVDEEFNYRWGL